MKYVPIKFGRYTSKATLKLGQTYIFADKYGKQKGFIFIRTGQKGFNFLGSNNKCILKKPIYQPNSSKRTIKRGQQVFDMAIPSWVLSLMEVEPSEQFKILNKSHCPPPVKVAKKEVLNALYRMDLEEI